jgi:D-inositol-3-phosphate glycosyltransferase
MTVYVRKVAEALWERGVHTDIFTRATASSTPISVLQPGVRVLAIPAGPPGEVAKEELTRYVDEFVDATRAFVSAQGTAYDLLHSHYWQSGLAARVLRQSWAIPWVHSQHTLAKVKNQQLAPGDLPEPADRIAGEEAIMAEADVLISSTDDEWRQLSCLYGVAHDRLKTIHPGVDHDLFSPGDRKAARAELGIGDEAMLVYAGRIQPLKGLDLAIRAVHELRGTIDRDVVLYLVGGASGATGTRERARLQELTHALGLERHVRFVGPAGHTEIPSYLRAADAAVVCSYSESFGLVALEAHACGTPVVATGVDGLAHIVRDGVTGFLVDTRDPESFAARLRILLSDEERWALLSRNALHVARAFSWGRTASGLFELYDCLLHERWPQLCTC